MQKLQTRSYRRVALRTHPDVDASDDAAAAFARAAEAYDVLSDGALSKNLIISEGVGYQGRGVGCVRRGASGCVQGRESLGNTADAAPLHTALTRAAGRKGRYDLYGARALEAGGGGGGGGEPGSSGGGSSGASGEGGGDGDTAPPYAFDAVGGPRAVFARFFGTANPYEALEALSGRFKRLAAPPAPPPPAVKTVELPVALEELWAGASKAVAVARGGFNEAGEAVTEARRLAVDVEAGAGDGTVFLFKG